MDSPLITAAKAHAKSCRREEFWDGVMWTLIPLPSFMVVIVEFIRNLQ